MSVYVDRLRSSDSKTGLKRWCKLWADTLEQRIGLANHLCLPMSRLNVAAGLTYYEITPEQRHEAIKAKALIYTVREWKHARKRARR